MGDSDAGIVGDPTDPSSVSAVNGSDAQSDAAAAAAEAASLGFSMADLSDPSFDMPHHDVVTPEMVENTPPQAEVNLLETIAKLSKFALPLISKAVPALAPLSLAYSLYNAANADSTTGIGKSSGSVVGSAMGGLASGNVVGAIAGGLAGSGLAQAAAEANAGNPGVGSGASTGDTGMDYGTLAGYGLGAYLSNNAANGYSSQMNNLASLYGQDSPYAQMLRKQLIARDAAAGRRSQYGAREVELQAKLADLNSRNATTLAQLQGAKSGTQMQTLANLYKMYGVANKDGAISNWARDIYDPLKVRGYSGVEGDTNFMGPTMETDWVPWDSIPVAEYAPPTDYSYLMG